MKRPAKRGRKSIIGWIGAVWKASAASGSPLIWIWDALAIGVNWHEIGAWLYYGLFVLIKGHSKKRPSVFSGIVYRLIIEPLYVTTHEDKRDISDPLFMLGTKTITSFFKLSRSFIETFSLSIRYFTLGWLIIIEAPKSEAGQLNVIEYILPPECFSGKPRYSQKTLSYLSHEGTTSTSVPDTISEYVLPFCNCDSSKLVPKMPRHISMRRDLIGWLSGLFSQASIAENIPTTISITIPPITNHSPQTFLNLQCLKSDKLLCQSFSENSSIKSPTKTNTPPEAANTTNQKIDPVVILLYRISLPRKPHR